MGRSVNVSGGTATIVYYSTLDYYDPFIGLTTYQPTVTGATLRVTAAIPNLAGSPVFNATVEYRLNYSDRLVSREVGSRRRLPG